MEAKGWVPTDDVLIAFDRGLLPEAEMDDVVAWLAATPEGESRLQRLTANRPDPAGQALRQGGPLSAEFDSADRLAHEIMERVLKENAAGPITGSGPLVVDAAMPETIREYRVVGPLGQGGMGRVFLARHSALQRDAAIKVLPVELAADPWYRARFQREMAVIGGLDHPNLVRAHDAGMADGNLFLAMELLQGADLNRLLTTRGPLPVAEACELVRQAALGLQHAHEHGVVHRDIKPSNLFLTVAGVVKVIDLGLAWSQDRASDSNQLSTGRLVVGTPDYLPPEQWDSTAVDHRADIYSLGCVLYQSLAGRPPHREYHEAQVPLMRLMLAHQTKEPPPLAERRPDVPAPLVNLVSQMLAKLPDERPSSARSVAETLSAFTGGHDLPALLRPSSNQQVTPRTQQSTTAWIAPEQTTTMAAPTRTRRKSWRLAVGVALVAAVLGGIVYWWPPQQSLSPPPSESPPGPHAALPDVYTNSVGMAFSRVPKGRAWLAGSGGTPGNREVEIPADFYLGTYEVTQEQWQKVMGGNPSGFSRTGADKTAVKDITDGDLKQFPVDSVSWDEAQQFVAELNRTEKSADWTYRLPTVVEWDYARRGGPMVDRRDGAFSFYFDKPTNQILPSQANFKHEQALGRPTKVGSYPPNRLGLHDLHGNLYEWTDDSAKAADYADGRLVRGGAYWLPADLMMGAGNALWVYGKYHDVGLRVARVPVMRADPRREDFDAWRKEVASLPAEKQVTAVVQLLKARNPNFRDTVTSSITAGVVTELTFITDNVTDLEPLRGLTGLQVLRCGGSGKSCGGLADLSPLKGISLVSLDCSESLVSDLNPLEGMKHLKRFSCQNARVANLSPLRGLPLEVLTCDFRPDRDEAVLRSLETLKTINDKSAEAFWKQLELKPEPKP